MHLDTALIGDPVAEALLDDLTELQLRWRAMAPRSRPLAIRVVPEVPGGSAVARTAEEIRVVPSPGGPGPLPATALALAQAALHPPHPVRSRLPWTPRPDGLLSRSLREGTADFLATLALGAHPAPSIVPPDPGLERSLWEAFSRALESDGPEGWFTPENEATDDAPLPPEAGRWMGYRIAHALWVRSGDPHEAVRELLAQSHPEEILDRSRYAGSAPEQGLLPSAARVGLPTWPGFDCRLVAVARNRHHLCVGGEGPLTLVLEADIGADHRSWHALAPALAREARVVVHDRAGLGESGPDGPDRTPAENAHALAHLLDVVSGPGPWILAGEGVGARNLEAFATLYPWRVLELALLDRPLPDPGGEAELPDRVVLELEGLAAAGAWPSPDDLPPVPVRRWSAGEGSREALLAHLIERVRTHGAASGIESPARRGEPTGCWRPEGPGAAQLPAPLRLALTPTGDAEAPVAGHRLEAPQDRAMRVGRWAPRGLDRLRIVVGASGANTTHELSRTSMGHWTGSTLSLVPHPCELPD